MSDAIDEGLRAERAALKKRTKPVKILLLGQAESGACLRSMDSFVLGLVWPVCVRTLTES